MTHFSNSKLLVLSHKEVWLEQNHSRPQFLTTGGFPLQIKYISHLFSKTHLVVGLRSSKDIPNNSIPIEGNEINILKVKTPAGKGFLRKINSVFWLIKNYSILNKYMDEADIVHPMLPGDIGFLGLIIALKKNKLIFIRHCGTWGNKDTLFDKIINWLLPNIASKRVLIFATGHDKKLPVRNNKYIQWIFSTSITEREMRSLGLAKPWDGKSTLRLISVSRLSFGKNISSLINAVKKLKEKSVNVSLSIIGDGDEANNLKNQVSLLNLENQICFYGNIRHSKVIEILLKSHLFVFPTNTKEGFPKALVEAMACGLPSIGTNISVIPILLEQGTGVVLNDTKPDDIYNAIKIMIAEKSKMEQMGIKARKIIESYTLERWKKDIFKYLSSEWNGQI
tara:strand:- start:7832 stop:9013 length:1182 start_codon:yes stop_codon:yes gene_type:complete